MSELTLIVEYLNHPFSEEVQRRLVRDGVDAGEGRHRANLGHRVGCKCTNAMKYAYDQNIYEGRKGEDIARELGVSRSRAYQLVWKVSECKRLSWKTRPGITDDIAARYLLELLKGLQSSVGADG
jgi:hypothetical protein